MTKKTKKTKPVKKKIVKNKKINYKYDLLSIGDATLDTFIKLSDASVLCNVNKNKCWLCLNYADKIQVEDLFHSIGGNAANNVVGANRLGLKSLIYTELGDDDSGQKVMMDFRKNKINTKFVKVQKKTNTNYSVIIKHLNERTILGYHAKRKYAFPKTLPAVKYIYLTSMSEGSEKIYNDVIEYSKKNQSKICFGPGSYQRKRGLSKMKKVLKNTFLYISNKEEAQDIFSYPKKAKDKEIHYLKLLMHKVHVYGPKIVVITDGRKGSYAYDGQNYYFLPIINDIKAKYPTGAGDAFSTGFIAALVNKKEIYEALRWGTFNASGVIQKMGPHYGLLNKAEMNRHLEKYKNIKLHII